VVVPNAGGEPDDATRSFEGLSRYRTFLQEHEQRLQGAYDKTVLVLSGGALAISLAFVKDIVPLPTACAHILLVLAWFAWAASLACVLVSLFTSILAFRRAVDQLDDDQIYLQHPGGLCDLLTCWLNVLSGLLFLAGLVLLLVFVLRNLP
jgi:hypothetical protein